MLTPAAALLAASVLGLSEAVQIALVTGATTVAGGALVAAPAIIAALRKADRAEAAANGAQTDAAGAKDAAETARDAIGEPNGEGTVAEMSGKILRELGGLRTEVRDLGGRVTALERRRH